ncbi:hypothetical protein KIPB_011611, partial [Kipferlia bialata]
ARRRLYLSMRVDRARRDCERRVHRAHMRRSLNQVVPRIRSLLYPRSPFVPTPCNSIQEEEAEIQCERMVPVVAVTSKVKPSGVSMDVNKYAFVTASTEYDKVLPLMRRLAVPRASPLEVASACARRQASAQWRRQHHLRRLATHTPSPPKREKAPETHAGLCFTLPTHCLNATPAFNPRPIDSTLKAPRHTRLSEAPCRPFPEDLDRDQQRARNLRRSLLKHRVDSAIRSCDRGARCAGHRVASDVEVRYLAARDVTLSQSSAWVRRHRAEVARGRRAREATEAHTIRAARNRLSLARARAIRAHALRKRAEAAQQAKAELTQAKQASAAAACQRPQERPMPKPIRKRLPPTQPRERGAGIGSTMNMDL